MEAKIRHIALPVKIFDQNIKNPVYLDMISFSLRIKMIYGSSAIHFKSIRDLANKLGVSHNTLRKRISSDMFDIFFTLDKENGRLIAKPIKDNGLYIKIKSAVNRSSMGNEATEVNVIFGGKKVRTYTGNEFYKNKSRKDIIREIALLIKINQQEFMVYSKKGTPIAPQPAREEGQSDDMAYLGCSIRRMSSKTGIGPTKVKYLLGMMADNKTIKKTKRVSFLLRISSGTDKAFREECINNTINGLQYVHGEFFKRHNLGISRSRSNIYSITPNGKEDNDDTITKRFFHKRDNLKRGTPDIDREPIPYIDVYAPDILNGVERYDYTTRVWIDKEGMEQRASFKVEYDKMSFIKKAPNPGHVRYAKALMIDIGPDNIIEAMAQLEEYLKDGLDDRKACFNDAYDIAGRMINAHRMSNKDNRKLGIKPEPYSTVAHYLHKNIVIPKKLNRAKERVYRIGGKGIALLMAMRALYNDFLYGCRKNGKVNLGNHIQVFRELMELMNWKHHIIQGIPSGISTNGEPILY